MPSRPGRKLPLNMSTGHSRNQCASLRAGRGHDGGRHGQLRPSHRCQHGELHGLNELHRGARRPWQIYPGTGVGPDRAYHIRTDAACNLTITMDPTDVGPDADDLALIVYQSACSDSLSDCVCVDDTGVGGVAEVVT